MPERLLELELAVHEGEDVVIGVSGLHHRHLTADEREGCREAVRIGRERRLHSRHRDESRLEAGRHQERRAASELDVVSGVDLGEAEQL